MADGGQNKSTEDENWARAEAFYETELLPKLLTTEKGNVLVLDIETGDYEVDADLLIASDRLQGRHPGAFGYTFRIGYPAVGKLRRSPQGKARLPGVSTKIMNMMMADERPRRFRRYTAEIVWHEHWKRIPALASENERLASANLLAGSHIEIDMIPGGVVTITELPSS